ncbi:MAG TPA: hypothetical protein VGY31_12860 [Terriglobia bacterium]|nr:hypothetical protein [Terriglobia bacterium]
MHCAIYEAAVFGSENAMRFRTDMNKRLETLLVELLCLLGTALLAASTQAANAKSGKPTFRDFNGVVYLLGAETTKQLGIGWAREGFYWSQIEPEKGKWIWRPFDRKVRAAQSEGVQILPLLGYNVSWDAGAGASGFSPPVRVEDWEDYVDHVVARYSAPPYDLRYFQIWNEPTKEAGFWAGTDHEFIDKVYLPAAKIIRRHHCFVVFGGWPASNSLEEFDSVLEYHDAWRWADFLDIHYEGLPDWQYLYNRWVKAGKCKGVWETELGFTSDPDFIPETYLPMLSWSLETGWKRPDQYKLFWYAAWGAGPNGPKCLSQTDARGHVILSDQGKRLALLNNLLGREALRAFTNYQVTMGSAKGSVLGFATDRRKVIAILLDKASLSDTQPIVARVQLSGSPKGVSVITEDGLSLSFTSHIVKKDDETVTFCFPTNMQGRGKLAVAYLKIVS